MCCRQSCLRLNLTSRIAGRSGEDTVSLTPGVQRHDALVVRRRIGYRGTWRHVACLVCASCMCSQRLGEMSQAFDRHRLTSPLLKPPKPLLKPVHLVMISLLGNTYMNNFISMKYSCTVKWKNTYLFIQTPQKYVQTSESDYLYGKYFGRVAWGHALDCTYLSKST